MNYLTKFINEELSQEALIRLTISDFDEVVRLKSEYTHIPSRFGNTEDFSRVHPKWGTKLSNLNRILGAVCAWREGRISNAFFEGDEEATNLWISVIRPIEKAKLKESNRQDRQAKIDNLKFEIKTTKKALQRLEEDLKTLKEQK